MTGLAESSALLLSDKARHVWQMICFAIVIRSPHLELMQHMGDLKGEVKESSERQVDQIESRGRQSVSQKRDFLFFLNKCET